MRSSPLSLPTGKRHRLPWRDTSRGLRVPLLTPEPEGELHQGMIRVPNHLVGAQQHTNERHAFEKLLAENVERWLAWYKQRGWELNSRPKVKGPYNPPTPRPGMESGEGEVKWYFVKARFKRSSPLYIRLDDYLELDRLAKLHGISFDGDGAQAEPIGDGPHDPMEFAEARRQRLGIQRKDYLFGGQDDRDKE